MISVLEKPEIRRRALPISVSAYHVMFEQGLVEERAELIRSEDVSAKWAAKVAEYKARIQQGDPAYVADKTHDALVSLLFPELFADEPA